MAGCRVFVPVMQNACLDRWLLVNYSGYPYALNSLILDNGLANLAGALLCEKRSARVVYQAMNPARKSGMRPPTGVSVWANTSLRSALIPLNCSRPFPLPPTSTTSLSGPPRMR